MFVRICHRAATSAVSVSCFVSHLAMVSSDSLVLRVARPDELDQVREVLRRIYYPEEGITVSYVHGKQHTLDDERFSLSFVEQGTVVVVEDRVAKKLIGISIAGAIYPGDPDLMEQEAVMTETKKWSDILKLLAFLERTADVCGRYQMEKAYHVHILAVDPTYRGHALGQRLLQFQMDLAKKMGFGAISGDFTSIFSANLAEKMGMKCINQLTLGDYRDEKGEKLFDPEDVYQVIRTCVKLL